jgi:hypothetical protein
VVRGLRRESATVRLLGRFESRQGMNVCMSIVRVVACQVEVSAAGRSFLQEVVPSVVCACVIVKSRQGGSQGTVRHGVGGGGWGEYSVVTSINSILGSQTTYIHFRNKSGHLPKRHERQKGVDVRLSICN